MGQGLALRDDVAAKGEDLAPEICERCFGQACARRQQFILEIVGLCIELSNDRFDPVCQPRGDEGDNLAGRARNLAGHDLFAQILGRLDMKGPQGDDDAARHPHADGDHVFWLRAFIEVHAPEVNQQTGPVAQAAWPCVLLQQRLVDHLINAAGLCQPVAHLRREPVEMKPAIDAGTFRRTGFHVFPGQTFCMSICIKFETVKERVRGRLAHLRRCSMAT